MAGQTLVEYALLLAFVALVVIVAVMAVGPVVADVFIDMGNQLQNGGTSPAPVEP